MSEELRSKLKAGDQIIATQDRRFPKSISPQEHYSQRVGDMIMVNNPNIGSLVGGTGLNGMAYDGRSNLGLGSSFEVGTFRLATPDDPGYLATRDQWSSFKDKEIRALRMQTFLLGAGLIVSLGYIAFSALAV